MCREFERRRARAGGLGVAASEKYAGEFAGSGSAHVKTEVFK